MTIMETDLHKLNVTDPFLGQYQRLVRDVVIPYQWDALNDRIPEADPSHMQLKISALPLASLRASSTAWFSRTAT